MKKSTLLKSAISAASVALVSSAAVAYDNDFDLHGTAQYELHSEIVNYEGIGSPNCGGGCTAFGGTADIQQMTTLRITNKTSLANGAAAGASIAECYDGDVATGDALLLERWIVERHGPTADGTFITVDDESLNETAFEAMDLCTNAEGKIVSGMYAFCSSVPLNACGFVNYTNRVAVAYDSGDLAFLPTVADTQDIIDNYFLLGLTPPVAGWGGDGVDPATEWNWGSNGIISYMTCDTREECGQLSKSVPVPAFAAAALGLGLFGITFVTGRRRTIK